ncbi:hypothetical protein [Methyloligella solikamskensis]|uniref:Transmembrane protein n=1 Tax=Methyloligella solikamskensis TaxID=1177756 RepID=A0ABW3JBL1_9HYPH
MGLQEAPGSLEGGRDGVPFCAMSRPPDQLDDPTDGRPVGDWRSRYSGGAWCQICSELAYLLLMLFAAITLLFFIGCSLAAESAEHRIVWLESAIPEGMLVWIAVGLSGSIGGITFTLKWLYHSVANNIWNQDRVLWRIIVPVISGLVSTFLAFVIFSNIVFLIRGESLGNVFFAMGFGFVFGYFSDSALAWLKKLADSVFGRTDPTPE